MSTPSLWRAVLVTITLLCGQACSGTAVAQQDCTPAKATVIDAALYQPPPPNPKDVPHPPSRVVELGDVISLSVTDFASLQQELQCRAKGNPRAGIVLYIDGRPLADLVAYPPDDPAPTPTSTRVRFTLKRTAAANDVWAFVLGRPAPTPRRIEVSLGLQDRYAMPSSATLDLRVMPGVWLLLWGVIFFGSLGAFVVLAAKTSILRGGTPAGGETFSLARSQAAIWFFVVVGSYLFIGLVTGDYVTSLNGTALTLLGITSATLAASAAIDLSNKNKDPGGAARNNAITNITAAIAGGNAGADADSQLKKLNGQSEGWLTDVLSTADGIDFHRYQILVWTIVLSVIFIAEVWEKLAMPEFNDTLLALQGLSAATFIGLKIPEATTPRT